MQDSGHSIKIHCEMPISGSVPLVRLRATSTYDVPNKPAPTLRKPGAIILVDPRPIYRHGLSHSLQPVLAGRPLIELASLAELSLPQPSCRTLFILTPLAQRSAKPEDMARIEACFPDAILVLLEETGAKSQSDMTGCHVLPEDCHPMVFVRKILSLLSCGAPEGKSGKNAERFEVEQPSIDALTVMQYRVLEMIAEGLLNKQIAWRCSISEATVKSHASEVFRKLKIQRRSEAAVLFTRLMAARAQDMLRGPDVLATAA